MPRLHLTLFPEFLREMKMLTRRAASNKNGQKWMTNPRNPHCSCQAILWVFKETYSFWEDQGTTESLSSRRPGRLMLKPGDGGRRQFPQNQEAVSPNSLGFWLYEAARAALANYHRLGGLNNRFMCSRPRCQYHGVDKVGFFPESLWLTDGCLLAVSSCGLPTMYVCPNFLIS